MSTRFTTNFVVLLLGAAMLVFLFAFERSVSDWVVLGAGAGSVVMGLYSFAMPAQGVYQRVADWVIVLIGAWAIVAARVMSAHGIWLMFGAGLALAVLGAIGLVVRELALAGGLQVGGSHIGPDDFVTLSGMQRDAGARQ